ncbi:MAG: hypothetical protein R3A79_15945 [Nannocystaceae bacterium]
MSESEETRAPATGAALEAAPTALVIAAPTRTGIVREFALFQGKLLIDGLKDLLLSPLSIAVLLLGLISPRYAPAMWTWLYGIGRRLDGWIDLFPDAAAADAPPPQGVGTMDAFVGEMEEVVRGLRRGGTADPAVQARLDAVLKSINSLVPTATPTPAPASASPSETAPPAT